MAQAHEIVSMQTAGQALSRDAHGCERAGHLAVLLICGTVLACALVLRPNEEGLSLFGMRWPLSCWLHDMTGVKCGLCGMSRSFCSLARGDLAAGVHFHRLGPLVFALFGLEIPYRLYALATTRRSRSTRLAWLHVRVVAVVFAAIVVNWLVYLGELLW